MSALGDKLVRDLTGAAPAPLGDFGDQLAELVRRAGSERALARWAGLDRKTLSR